MPRTISKPTSQFMPSDYYSDSPEAPTMEAPAPAEAAPAEEGRKTTLIPQSLCPGMSAGDTIELKIDRVMDSEYEVSYQETEPEERAEAAPMPAPEMSQMGSMME